MSLSAISSMATRAMLAAVCESYREETGIDVALESVGGVEVARRIRAGEAFDAVVLANDALADLEAAGFILRGSGTPVAASGIVAAVSESAPLPDIHSEAALRETILAAKSLGYSTGPSGVHLLRLFERWGIAERLSSRLVQAPPGVSVGTLIASRQVEIGFQQSSELIDVPGIRVAGELPPGAQLVTVFSAGVCSASARHQAAREWIAFLASPEAAPAKRRHGMEPPAVARDSDFRYAPDTP